jgi:hypothetical protein
MTFDENGFLGKQINEISQDIESRHKRLFDLGYELNRYSFNFRNKLSIDISKGMQVIGASLFSRIHNGSQAIVLLSRVGLNTEAKVLLRTILESTFVLKAISDNEDELIRFINTDKKKQERLLKYIFEKDKLNVYGDLRQALNKEQLKMLRDEIKEESIRDIEVHEWASKAGMDTF